MEIIEAAMVSTNEKFTYNSLIWPSQSVTVKKPSARKSLHEFPEELDVKHKTCLTLDCVGKTVLQTRLTEN